MQLAVGVSHRRRQQQHAAARVRVRLDPASDGGVGGIDGAAATDLDRDAAAAAVGENGDGDGDDAISWESGPGADPGSRAAAAADAQPPEVQLLLSAADSMMASAAGAGAGGGAGAGRLRLEDAGVLADALSGLSSGGDDGAGAGFSPGFLAREPRLGSWLDAMAGCAAAAVVKATGAAHERLSLPASAADGAAGAAAASDAGAGSAALQLQEGSPPPLTASAMPTQDSGSAEEVGVGTGSALAGPTPDGCTSASGEEDLAAFGDGHGRLPAAWQQHVAAVAELVAECGGQRHQEGLARALASLFETRRQAKQLQPLGFVSGGSGACKEDALPRGAPDLRLTSAAAWLLSMPLAMQRTGQAADDAVPAELRELAEHLLAEAGSQFEQHVQQARGARVPAQPPPALVWPEADQLPGDSQPVPQACAGALPAEVLRPLQSLTHAAWALRDGASAREVVQKAVQLLDSPTAFLSMPVGKRLALSVLMKDLGMTKQVRDRHWYRRTASCMTSSGDGRCLGTPDQAGQQGGGDDGHHQHLHHVPMYWLRMRLSACSTAVCYPPCCMLQVCASHCRRPCGCTARRSQQLSDAPPVPPSLSHPLQPNPTHSPPFPPQALALLLLQPELPLMLLPGLGPQARRRVLDVAMRVAQVRGCTGRGYYQPVAPRCKRP